MTSTSNPNTLNNSGWTLIHVAAWKGNSIEIEDDPNFLFAHLDLDDLSFYLSLALSVIPTERQAQKCT